MISRRKFLGTVIGSAGLAGLGRNTVAHGSPQKVFAATSQVLTSQGENARIDRAAIVTRHNPVIRKLDPLAPLSLGNGEFAFTGDITGLQTFPLEYQKAMPLCTMAQWGWHSTSIPPGLDPKSFRLTQYETHGRPVGYQTSSEGQTELYTWLRENPHRLHLGQIGLRLVTVDQREARPTDISEIDQSLDLWTGLLTSRFRFQSTAVTVKTSVHPTLDLLAVTIESTLMEQARLAVRFAFPYGSSGMEAADWNQVDRHVTQIIRQTGRRIEFRRTLDADQYFVVIECEGQARLVPENAHAFLLKSASEKTSLEFVVAFSPQAATASLPTAAQTFLAGAEHWKRFWREGSAIELAESKDQRAPELERRVVLSST